MKDVEGLTVSETDRTTTTMKHRSKLISGTKRKVSELPLEARHTISLEIAKKRRLSVPCSIFLPKDPKRTLKHGRKLKKSTMKHPPSYPIQRRPLVSSEELHTVLDTLRAADKSRPNEVDEEVAAITSTKSCSTVKNDDKRPVERDEPSEGTMGARDMPDLELLEWMTPAETLAFMNMGNKEEPSLENASSVSDILRRLLNCDGEEKQHQKSVPPVPESLEIVPSIKVECDEAEVIELRHDDINLSQEHIHTDENNKIPNTAVTDEHSLSYDQLPELIEKHLNYEKDLSPTTYHQSFNEHKVMSVHQQPQIRVKENLCALLPPLERAEEDVVMDLTMCHRQTNSDSGGMLMTPMLCAHNDYLYNGQCPYAKPLSLPQIQQRHSRHYARNHVAALAPPPPLALQRFVLDHQRYATYDCNEYRGSNALCDPFAARTTYRPPSQRSLPFQRYHQPLPPLQQTQPPPIFAPATLPASATCTATCCSTTCTQASPQFTFYYNKPPSNHAAPFTSASLCLPSNAGPINMQQKQRQIHQQPIAYTQQQLQPLPQNQLHHKATVLQQQTSLNSFLGSPGCRYQQRPPILQPQMIPHSSLPHRLQFQQPTPETWNYGFRPPTAVTQQQQHHRQQYHLRYNRPTVTTTTPLPLFSPQQTASSTLLQHQTSPLSAWQSSSTQRFWYRPPQSCCTPAPAP